MLQNTVLRFATLRDADMLLDWRNDATTRNASHRTVEVQRDEHIRWLTEVLGDPDRKLFIAEEDGVPVGTVRADLIDGGWKLSWTTAPSARGRGVATRMVSLLARELKESICAEVKSDNAASALVAERAGMQLEFEAEGILHFRRPPLDE